ncbi:MAG: hypothetical protein JW726_06185 [Anaerolineales bacterium]|nr:hypothetical protein [Anaerolineales bacterium]
MNNYSSTNSALALPEANPAPIYLQLRNMILSLRPDQAGLRPTPAAPHVWGVLMETRYPQAVSTLVCLADGTTSLYFSTGGGMLGSGQHLPVARAAKKLVAAAEDYYLQAEATSEFALPADGMVQFCLLTYTRAYSIQAEEKQLAGQQHPFSALFFAAHEVITQVRLLQESQTTKDG